MKTKYVRKNYKRNNPFFKGLRNLIRRVFRAFIKLIMFFLLFGLCTFGVAYLTHPILGALGGVGFLAVARVEFLNPVLVLEI